MNDISRWNGDSIVTDKPSCTHPILASIAQLCNDSICVHRDSMLLCANCSKVMLDYRAALSTTPAPNDPFLAKRLAVTMAVATRVLVEPTNSEVAAAYDAAQGWLDGTVTAAECLAASHITSADSAYGTYSAWVAAIDYDELLIAHIGRASTKRWFWNGRKTVEVLDVMIEAYRTVMQSASSIGTLSESN